jgi:uncharacterized repeat protein (TIGR03803 family)
VTSLIRMSIVTSATFAAILLCTFAAIVSQPAHAQSLTVLHNFNGFPDGRSPKTGLSMDGAGNLYGTTTYGGDPDCDNGGGCGTVFSLKHETSGWILGVLQTFTGTNGLYPLGRVVFGPEGALYGTVAAGGPPPAYGLIFRLSLPPNICRSVTCPWTETQLYNFQGLSDGVQPESEVLFDQAGNFYGTAEAGAGHGVVYKMTRSGSGWSYGVIYYFTGSPDGQEPIAGLTFDQAGNLYGTTWSGGTQNYGSVYQLTPSGGSWQETVLHSFPSAGFVSPYAGVTLDQAGNLYGGTAANGSAYRETVYDLSPASGRFTTLNMIGNSVLADLTFDSAGNLYGTFSSDTFGECGEVFELSPQGGDWIYRTIHSFQGSDGCQPASTVLIDANGNMFGTTTKGGTYNDGVVWEITP